MHVRNFCPTIVALVVTLWDQQPLRPALVSLVEAIGRTMDSEFKPFLPKITPLFIRIFDGELNSSTAEVQTGILRTLPTFGTSLEKYLSIFIPAIVKSYDSYGKPATPHLRKQAVQTIEALSRKINLSDHASRVIHPLARVLETSNNELRMTVMDTLCVLMLQLGPDFVLFMPTINKVFLTPRFSMSTTEESNHRHWHTIESTIPAMRCWHSSFSTGNLCGAMLTP